MLEKLFEDIRNNLKEFDEKYDKDEQLRRLALLDIKVREEGYGNVTPEEQSKWILGKLKFFKGRDPMDGGPNLYTRAKRLFKKINPPEEEKRLKVNTLLQKDKLEEATALINAGGDINQKTFWGHTPLRIALEKGHLDIAKLLVNKGAEVNVRDREGHTIVQAMIKNGDAGAVKFLLGKGADLSLERKAKNYPTESTSEILKSASPEVQKIVKRYEVAKSLQKNNDEPAITI